MGRVDGEDDMEAEGPSELLFWKRLLTSNLGRFGVEDEVDVDGVAEEEAVVDDVDGAVEDVDAADAAEGGVPVENEIVREWCFPFEVAAGTDPNDLIPSGLMVGTVAGDDDMGADASSMDPKVTDDPVKG